MLLRKVSACAGVLVGKVLAFLVLFRSCHSCVDGPRKPVVLFTTEVADVVLSSDMVQGYHGVAVCEAVTARVLFTDVAKESVYGLLLGLFCRYFSCWRQSLSLVCVGGNLR